MVILHVIDELMAYNNAFTDPPSIQTTASEKKASDPHEMIGFQIWIEIPKKGSPFAIIKSLVILAFSHETTTNISQTHLINATIFLCQGTK